MTSALSTFGAGGEEPYAQALRRDDQMIYLRDARSDSLAPSFVMDVARWSDDADPTDVSLLEGVTGAVLDIGCGPGRMVKAAMALGLAALGIDVSPTAIDIASEAGLMVLKRSVFERLPREGSWGLALLVDGNIGIGGDPTALMKRCAELIADDGSIVVEVHSDRQHDLSYHGTIVDMHGNQSDEFPWSEIGSSALEGRAYPLGLELEGSWETGGRAFCRFVRSARA